MGGGVLDSARAFASTQSTRTGIDTCSNSHVDKSVIDNRCRRRTACCDEACLRCGKDLEGTGHGVELSFIIIATALRGRDSPQHQITP